MNRLSPGRPRPRVLFFAVLILVSLAPQLAQAQSQSSPPTSKAPPPPPPPPAEDQQQFLSYWTTETGWQTELQLRNNQARGILTITPVLRAADGTETPLFPVVVQPQEVKTVDVATAIGSSAPLLIGAYGSVVLRYRSSTFSGLYAVAMIHGVGHSVAFHIDGTGELEEYQAGSREGIWWLPNSSSSDYLVLVNKDQNALPLALSLFDSNGKAFTQNLTLAPAATSRLSVRQLIIASGLTGAYGGIRVSAASHAESLNTLHVLFDDSVGFSAILKMFDHDPNPKLPERDFAHTGIWTLRAPMLALSNPDPALLFPSGTKLQPQIFIRNTTGKPLDAALRFNWRANTTTGKAAGPQLHLLPYETRLINLAALQDGTILPKEANWTSVTLTTSGLPDELMAVAASYDQTLKYGAQTPFSDQLSHHWKGGMWELDAYHDSIITAGNGGTKPTQAAFTIFYNQGTQKYELEQTLQPDEQMWMDIGKLIRENIPDKNGKTLPATLTSGSYEVRDLTNNGIGALFEGKVIYDKTYGHVTYGCAICCGYNAAVLWYDPIDLLFQGAPVDDGVYGFNVCEQQYEDVSSSFYGNWKSAATTIITVDTYGTHTPHSVGSTTTDTLGDIESCAHYPTCPAKQFPPSGSGNTISISQSPSILNMSSGDTATGITVSVAPTTVASSVVFSVGGVTNLATSSSTASFTYNKPSTFTGNDLWKISIGGANSPSGTQDALACTFGVCAPQLSSTTVPPQILIQMMQAETNGTTDTAMTAVGEVVRNRFNSSIFNPPYSTYQNAIPGQFATTSTTTGVEPELDIATSVFTGVSAGNFCGSLAFWSPTTTQWQNVQTALQSGTTTFPSNIGAPTFNPSLWPTSQQQILFVTAIGSNQNGVPFFLFLTPRSSTQSAAINTSCN
jgi:hypothetical protein